MFDACDRGEDYFHEWEGEYTMETHSFVIDSNGNEGHSFPSIFSTISVFFKGNNIFVSTNHFGKPNIDLENFETEYLKEKLEKKPSFRVQITLWIRSVGFIMYVGMVISLQLMN